MFCWRCWGFRWLSNFKCNGMSDCDPSHWGQIAEYYEDVLGWSWVVCVFAVWAALGEHLGMSIIAMGKVVWGTRYLLQGLRFVVV